LLEVRVKPPAFDYLAPASLDEALALRAEHGSDARSWLEGKA
jgi:hypothetical protein